MKTYKLIPFDESKQNEVNNSDVIIAEDVKSSSSNNVYKVTIYKDKISCTCPAGGKKTFCKHMLNTINKNVDLIKNNNISFYEQLQSLIELKQNHKGREEQFKKLSADLIFVNSSIAKTAHDNQIEFEKDKIKQNVLYENIISIVINQAKN